MFINHQNLSYIQQVYLIHRSDIHLDLDLITNIWLHIIRSCFKIPDNAKIQHHRWNGKIKRYFLYNPSYRCTLISLNTRTPSKFATTAGPVVTIGNATASDRTLLATNQHVVPPVHNRPEMQAGSITLGQTFGRFLMQTA